MDEEVIACQLMGPEFAARKARIAADLFARTLEVHERPDGFSYRFASDTATAVAIAEFVEAERMCCPFLRFEMVFEPNHGPIWLTLNGSARAKAFIADELGLAVNSPSG